MPAPAANFASRTLFHSDNLPILQGMNSETVDLIATDPPFNKGKDFHATPESLAAGARFQDRWSWDADVHEEWTDAIQDDYPKVWRVIQSARHSCGDDMGAFLRFMGVRIMEMHRVLKPTGSIYPHCDPTASHYLKALMDAVFGRRDFRNEIVWAYTGPSNAQRWFPRKHDVILFYAKDDKRAVFNRDAVRVPYVKHETCKTSGIFKREAALSRNGKVVEDWRDDLTPVGRIAGERVGYPTQKPLALYERVIKASSNPGDFVLDPFTGCATTPIAAERLGRRWVGIDLWEGAADIVKRRLADEGLITDEPTDHLITFGDLTFATEPPVRTDDGESAAPNLKSRWRIQRATERWRKLTRREIVERLVRAQGTVGGVICGGCGRILEREFMQLDHMHPRAEGGANDISNRILLCAPRGGRQIRRLDPARLDAPKPARRLDARRGPRQARPRQRPPRSRANARRIRRLAPKPR